METIAQAVSEWDAPSVSLFILGAAILVVGRYAPSRSLTKSYASPPATETKRNLATLAATARTGTRGGSDPGESVRTLSMVRGFFSMHLSKVRCRLFSARP